MEISKVADNLVSYAGIFQCSFKEAWEKHLPELLTKDTSFQEVINYINYKIALGDKYKF
jgi:hypothetical protein